MRILWRLGGGAAREVYTEAGERHGWSVSTVKTLLRRLVEKGSLETTRVGNSFYYRPSGTALAALKGAADGLLENALEGTVGPLLAHMVKRSQLAGEDLAELRDLLEASGGGGGEDLAGLPKGLEEDDNDDDNDNGDDDDDDGSHGDHGSGGGGRGDESSHDLRAGDALGVDQYLG